MSEPKPKKKKTKDNAILPKPKRPMSAYNYFFQEQRKVILEPEGLDGSNGENKMSFQDIGRLIGQRWREIKPDELAKYEEMAKEDLERYRQAMEVFRKEELALMCSGHVLSPNEDGDKKQSALPQQQKKPEVAAAVSSAAPQAASGAPKFDHAVLYAMSVDQLLQFQSMIEQQGYGSINKEEIIAGISAERANIKQRLAALIKESEALQLRDLLLERITLSCLAATNSGRAQAAFPHIVSQPASLPSYDALLQLQQQQLGAGLLGQLRGLNENAALNRLMSSDQQLHRHLAHAAFANQMPTHNPSDPATVSGQSSSQIGWLMSGHQAAAQGNLGLTAHQQATRDDASLLHALLAQQLGGAPAPTPKSNPDEKKVPTSG